VCPWHTPEISDILVECQEQATCVLYMWGILASSLTDFSKFKRAIIEFPATLIIHNNIT
jgi:hypothetical protein